jgi:hypothetical protein
VLKSKHSGAKPAGKPISLYPLTFDEALDKLLKAPPEHARSKKKPVGPKAKD